MSEIAESLHPTPGPSHEPDPNRPSWSSATAVGVWILSVLLVVFVPSLLVLPYLIAQGATDRESTVQVLLSDPNAILIQVAAILPVHLITLAIAWLVVTKVRKEPFLASLGWRSGGMRWWHYIAIMVGFVGLMGVVGYFFPEQENELLRILKSSKAALLTVAVLAVFTAPFVEELVYRGVAFSAFQRSFGTVPAVLLVTLLFALVHVPQYWPSFSTIFLLTLLSLILTVIRAVTGNLLPAVILHTIFNGFQSALLIAGTQFGELP